MKTGLKSILFLFIFCGGVYHSFAQQTKVYFGLGGVYNSFQDSRFSNVQYGRSTVIPELGFSRVSEKDYYFANANVFLFNYNFPNLDTIEFSNLTYNVRLGYLRNISKSFYLGVNWDVVDYYKRQTTFLGNGSDAYRLSSDVFASGKYIYDLSDDWQFNFGLDFGLFTFVNTEPSFSANFQQNIIDNGEVTFIDSDTKLPYKVKNMDFRPFWEQINLRTAIQLSYKRRFSLYYSWDMRTFSDNKGYPVTNARHMLTLRINFVNHLKN